LFDRRKFAFSGRQMPHSSGTPCVLWYKPYRFGGF